LDKFDHSGIDADLIIEKNRNGRTGFVKLLFFPYRMEFLEKSRYDEKDRPEI
jgi:replicative DNA helicase